MNRRLRPNRSNWKDSRVRLRASSRTISEDALKPKPNHKPNPNPKKEVRKETLKKGRKKENLPDSNYKTPEIHRSACDNPTNSARWQFVGNYGRHSFRIIPSTLIPVKEYQIPKEQTLCYSENKIADVTKIKAMRPRKSRYAIFPPNDGRKLPKEHDYRLFCVFRTNRYSVYTVNSAIGSRIDGYYSVHSGIRIGPKKNTIIANSVYSHSEIVPKRTRPI